MPRPPLPVDLPSLVEALVRLGAALRGEGLLLPGALPGLSPCPALPGAAAVSTEPVLRAPTTPRSRRSRPVAAPAPRGGGRPRAGAVPDGAVTGGPLTDARAADTRAADGRVPDSAVPDGSADTAALVAAAQAGSADAFGLLYDAYVDLVHRYVGHRVGSPALAEDLTSEVFLRALRRIDSFTWQGRDFGAWLVTIARNLVADHYKSGRSRLEVTTDDVTVAAVHPTTAGPESLVLDLLRDRALLDAVRRLPAEQQECVSLRFLQGMSVAETALVLGKGEGAVKALQYRAVRALGRLLAAESA